MFSRRVFVHLEQESYIRGHYILKLLYFHNIQRYSSPTGFVKTHRVNFVTFTLTFLTRIGTGSLCGSILEFKVYYHFRTTTHLVLIQNYFDTLSDGGSGGCVCFTEV